MCCSILGDPRPNGPTSTSTTSHQTEDVGIGPWVRPWPRPCGSRQGIQRFGHFAWRPSMRRWCRLVLDCSGRPHLSYDLGDPESQRIGHLRHRAGQGVSSWRGEQLRLTCTSASRPGVKLHTTFVEASLQGLRQGPKAGGGDSTPRRRRQGPSARECWSPPRPEARPAT